MERRSFLKSLFWSSVVGGLSIAKRTWADESDESKAQCRIWSYYVPLVSYADILETFEGMNSLDRKVIFNQVIKKTNRINGKETDGTKNGASFALEDLQNASEYLRVHFWHDDNGDFRPSGHNLHVFKRYLEDLENGKAVFVATGVFQSHFHVVMIQPPL